LQSSLLITAFRLLRRSPARAAWLTTILPMPVQSGSSARRPPTLSQPKQT
jgi:hypothetical protein